MKTLKDILNNPLTYALSYLLAAVFTFGHAYTHGPKGYTSSWSPHSYIEYGIFEKVFMAGFASFAWPLYASVQFQKEDK
jgi:hypothetical protein